MGAGPQKLRRVLRHKILLDVSPGDMPPTPPDFSLLPVLEEPTEAKGHQFENRLQDKDDSEDVITDLQSLIQDLARMGARCRVSSGTEQMHAPLPSSPHRPGLGDRVRLRGPTSLLPP